MSVVSLDSIKKTLCVHSVTILLLFAWTCFIVLSKHAVFPAHWNEEFPKMAAAFFLLIPLVAVIQIRSFQSFNSSLLRFAKDFSISIFLYGFLLCLLYAMKGQSLYFLYPVAGLFLIIPFSRSDLDVDAKIYQFGLQTFFQGFLAALYVFIFGAGFFLFLMSLDHLFGIKLTYTDILVVEASFIFPSLLLMMMPQDLTSDLREISPKWVMFYLFALIPILALCAVNLHIYFVKILIEGVFPKGMITIMTVIYGIIGYKVYWLMHVIEEKSKAMSLFYKIFPYTMILPLFMMAQALFMRIHQHGFTFLRLYMCVLGAGLILMTLQTVFIRRKSLYWGIIVFMIPFFLILSFLIVGENFFALRLF